MSVEKININPNNNFDYLHKFRSKNNILDSNVSLFNNNNNNKNKNKEIIETESSQEYIIKNDIDKLPIGTIILYPIKKIPPGFLKCNGRKYLISLYNNLYDIIGNLDTNDNLKFIIPKLISPDPNYCYIIKY